MYQILSVSTWFCGRYDKNISVFFSVHSIDARALFSFTFRGEKYCRKLQPPRCTNVTDRQTADGFAI